MPVDDVEPEVVLALNDEVLEALSVQAVHEEAGSVLVDVLTAGVLDNDEPQAPHVAGSVETTIEAVLLVEVLTAGVLLVEDQTAQVLGSAEVEVFTAGVLELELDQTAHVAGSVLVCTAGVLEVALSHWPHAVELAEVAITGVGNPAHNVSNFPTWSSSVQLTNWWTIRDTDLDLAVSIGVATNSGNRSSNR